MNKSNGIGACVVWIVDVEDSNTSVHTKLYTPSGCRMRCLRRMFRFIIFIFVYGSNVFSFFLSLFRGCADASASQHKTYKQTCDCVKMKTFEVRQRTNVEMGEPTYMLPNARVKIENQVNEKKKKADPLF